MRKVSAMAAAAFAVVGLSGCIVPMDYDLTLHIKADETYAATWEGLVYSNGVAMDISRTGEDFPAGSKSKDLYGTTEGTGMFEDAHYLGAGLFEGHGSGEGNMPVNDVDVVPIDVIPQTEIVTIFAKNSDVWEIEAPDLTDASEVSQAVRKTGMPSRGTVCIKSDLPVVEHNADREPNGTSDCYLWNVEGLKSEDIKMVVSGK